MKYIKNNTKYALSFFIKEENKEDEEIICTAFRRYADTKRVATTGVIPITEKKLEWLKLNSRAFKGAIKRGDINIRNTDVNAAGVVAANQLESENEKLKKELQSKTDEINSVHKPEIDKLVKENTFLQEECNSFKERLEALGAEKETQKPIDGSIDGSIEDDGDSF